MLFDIGDNNKKDEPENEDDRKATLMIYVIGMLVSASLMVVGAIF